MICSFTNYLHSEQLAYVLGFVFIVLNMLDAHSTWLVIRPNHFMRERNPIARWVFLKLGIPRGILIFKTAMLAILIPCMVYYLLHDAFTINIVLIVADLLFCWVVWHNYKHYKQRINFERGM